MISKEPVSSEYKSICRHFRQCTAGLAMYRHNVDEHNAAKWIDAGVLALFPKVVSRKSFRGNVLLAPVLDVCPLSTESARSRADSTCSLVAAVKIQAN